MYIQQVSHTSHRVMHTYAMVNGGSERLERLYSEVSIELSARRSIIGV
jgi:hypothetical protein